jgi:hypothetical protein
MPTLALALTMLELEQAVTSRREQAAIEPEPRPRDASGRAARAAVVIRRRAESAGVAAGNDASPAGRPVPLRG